VVAIYLPKLPAPSRSDFPDAQAVRQAAAAEQAAEQAAK